MERIRASKRSLIGAGLGFVAALVLITIVTMDGSPGRASELLGVPVAIPLSLPILRKFSSGGNPFWAILDEPDFPEVEDRYHSDMGYALYLNDCYGACWDKCTAAGGRKCADRAHAACSRWTPYDYQAVLERFEDLCDDRDCRIEKTECGGRLTISYEKDNQIQSASFAPGA